jgi:hypothetical protein
MKDWHSEEEIKAQLRELTEQTRKLRSDLYSLIRPSKKLGPRGFIQESGTPKPNTTAADDNRRRPGKQK